MYSMAPIRDFNLASCYEALKLQIDELSGGELDNPHNYSNDVDLTFRWRFYLKCSHVNTYNYIYGNPKTDEDKRYKDMVDYYFAMISDCKYYMSLKCQEK